MIRLMKRVAVGTIVLAGLAGTGMAQAQSHDAMVGPWWNYFEPVSMHMGHQMAMMKPEERSKVMAMEDKMAQMEMDFKVQMAKEMAQHEMEMAKMRRDVAMYINSVYPPVGGDHQ